VDYRGISHCAIDWWSVKRGVGFIPALKREAFSSILRNLTIGLNDYSGWYVRRDQDDFELVGGWDSFQAIEPYLNSPSEVVVNDAFEEAGLA
jgi:hypothetical protein